MAPQRDESLGGLRLDVTPKNANVYVDGAIAGTVDDFNGHFQRMKLPPGPHQIELRARGYVREQFDVNIRPGETLRYHDRMQKS
jgi:PEGA domain-containing protein